MILAGRHNGGKNFGMFGPEERTAGGQVNHRRLNASAEEILRLTAVAAAGILVRDLVRLQVRAGRSQAVARASLSRTLRRLWRAGLVELHDRWSSLSAKQQEARDRLVRFEGDPRGSYEDYKSWARRIGTADRYGSAEAFLAAKRTQANAMPNLRAVVVTATTRGRELIGRLETTSALSPGRCTGHAPRTPQPFGNTEPTDGP